MWGEEMKSILDILSECATYDKLKAEATPGPWHVTRDDWTIEEPETDETVWTVGPNADGENWATDSGQNGYGILKQDATFIAHAHNWEPTKIIRGLVEELKDFQNALDERDELINKLQDVVNYYENTICHGSLLTMIQGNIQDEAQAIKAVDVRRVIDVMKENEVLSEEIKRLRGE